MKNGCRFGFKGGRIAIEKQILISEEPAAQHCWLHNSRHNHFAIQMRQLAAPRAAQLTTRSAYRATESTVEQALLCQRAVSLQEAAKEAAG